MRYCLTGLALLIVWAYGRVLVALLPSTVRMGRLERAGLSWLSGAAYLGFWTQMVIIVAGSMTRWAWIASAVPIVVALRFVFHRRSRDRGERDQVSRPGVAAILGAVVLIVVLTSLTITSLNSGPGWDGIYNWAIKAEVLYLGDDLVRGATANYFQTAHWQFSHAGYPLTLPALEAWLYVWVGGVDERLTMVVGPTFLMAGVAILIGFLTPITGALRATLLGTLLASVPLVTDLTATSYADIPFAIALLAAIIGCARWLSDDGAAYDCVIWLAILPLIKLEGLFYAAVLCAATIILAVNQGRVRRLRLLSWSAIAVAVSVGPWRLYLRSSAAIDGDFVTPSLQSLSAGLERIPRLWDLAYSTISSSSVFGILPILLPLAVFAGWRQLQKPVVIFVAAVLAAGSLFSAFIFILSNWPDFHRHAYHTVDRLFLHLVPSAILLMGLLLVDDLSRMGVAEIEEAGS